MWDFLLFRTVTYFSAFVPGEAPSRCILVQYFYIQKYLSIISSINSFSFEINSLGLMDLWKYSAVHNVISIKLWCEPVNVFFFFFRVSGGGTPAP